jgi:hypothetical protein
MSESWWDNIANNYLPFSIILISGAIAIIIIGKGLLDILDRLLKIIKTIASEFSGKARAKQAALYNSLLMILIAILAFLVLSPNLLSSLGLNETNSNTGYFVIIIIAFCCTGIWSGHFIRQYDLEGNAYRNFQEKGDKKRK